MAWGKKKKLDNNAIAELPPVSPTETTINHNYAPSRAGLVFAIFCSLVMGVILFWNALVFLADKAGHANPDKAVADFILFVFVSLCLLAIFVPALYWLLGQYYAFKIEMEERKADYMGQRARYAQLAPPQVASGMTGEDTRKYITVKLVMDKAYHGGIMTEDGKIISRSIPWSARQVGAIKLPGERKEIGKDSNLAAWVYDYLLGCSILLDERTVNVAKFPDLSHVEAQLVKDFDRPVVSGGGFSRAGQYVINSGGDEE